MKTLLIICLLTTVAFTGNLSLSLVAGPSDASNGQIYNLQCAGNVGSVIYSASGLPSGVTLNGNQIVIGPSAQAGTWTIVVTGTDSASGQTTQKTVNLSISVNSSSSTSTPAGGISGLATNYNTVNLSGNSYYINGASSTAPTTTSTYVLPSTVTGVTGNTGTTSGVTTGTYTPSSTTLSPSTSTTSYTSTTYTSGSAGNIPLVNPNGFPSFNLPSGTISFPSGTTGFPSGTTGFPSGSSPSGSSPSGSSPSGSFPSGSFPSGSFPSGSSPSGSNPSGSSPSGSSPSGSSPSAPQNPSTTLNSLISTYSTVTTVVPQYPGGTYPTANLPTAPTSNLPNPTPILISNQQTQPNDSNRNQITPDDVIVRAASERHQNAIKAITNLLTIIDQANANKNQAQTLISKYTNDYNTAVQNQRQSQNDIISIETTLTQITSAINNINAKIAGLQNQANDFQSQRAIFVQQVTTYQTQINSLTPTRDSLVDQLNKLIAQLNDAQTKLTSTKQSLTTVQTQISNNNDQITALTNQYNNIDITISQLTTTLNNKQSVVDDLQRRLTQAIADRDSAKSDLDKAVTLKNTFPDKINALRQTNSGLQTQVTQIQTDVTTWTNTVNSLTASINDLKGKIDNLNNQINQLKTQITSITIQIQTIDSNSGSPASQIQDLNSQLAFLKDQYSKSTITRQNLYNAGNDANNKVAAAKQNLDAALTRFKSETTNVATATQNLEKARAEEALARTALEELIAKYSDGLPYAIVPNGNGNTYAGTPAGNNPSGSPLGPIIYNGSGAQGSYTVSSWTSYLSQAFGAGVNPAFPGSVTALYPFSFSSRVRGNTVINGAYSSSSSSSSSSSGSGSGNIRGDNDGDFGFNGQNGLNGMIGVYGQSGCGGNGASQSITGTISAVRDDSFDVTTASGDVYTISVSPCTSLTSNRQQYTAKKGDVAVVKATQSSSSFSSSSSSSSYAGQNVVCLA